MQYSRNSFERYRIPPNTSRNQSSQDFSPRSHYQEYCFPPNNDDGTNLHIKIIFNECCDKNNALDGYQKDEDSEYTRFVSIPNGNIRISNYKLIKTDGPKKNLSTSLQAKPNRRIYLPEPELDIIRSESNNEVLFRKSFKPISGNKKKLFN